MVSISFHFQQEKIKGFKSSQMSSWLKKVLKHYGVSNAELGYVFVSDEFLLEMNRDHLNHDYYTDIITFNYNEENSLGGEMYISLDRVRDNAFEFSGGDFERELSRVVVHGLLHLIGYNDKTKREEAVMRDQEEFCLSLK